MKMSFFSFTDPENAQAVSQLKMKNCIISLVLLLNYTLLQKAEYSFQDTERYMKWQRCITGADFHDSYTLGLSTKTYHLKVNTNNIE